MTHGAMQREKERKRGEVKEKFRKINDWKEITGEGSFLMQKKRLGNIGTYPRRKKKKIRMRFVVEVTNYQQVGTCIIRRQASRPEAGGMGQGS